MRTLALRIWAHPGGNGNLYYTVSQDTSNNRHSVRGEDYTSFNMPSQFK